MKTLKHLLTTLRTAIARPAGRDDQAPLADFLAAERRELLIDQILDSLGVDPVKRDLERYRVLEVLDPKP